MPTIITPNTDQVRAIFQDPEVSELGPMPPAVRRVLDDIAAQIDNDATITVARDWERCIFALVDAPRPQRFDVLAITENGRVGHGGINQPRYHDNVGALVAHDSLEGFDARCVRAYAPTIAAMRDAGLVAELIDTGASCKAIWIDGEQNRPFKGDMTGLMLTAGGPLSDARNSHLNWEGGIYNADGEQVASLLYPHLTDAPQHDHQFAEEIARLAAVIR